MENSLKSNDSEKVRLHATIKRARTKTGREKVSKSFSVTKEQDEWLDNYLGNSSELVSRLLGDFIETSEKTQPTAIKLSITRKNLLKQLEVTETMLRRSERTFSDWTDKLKYAVKHKDSVLQFSKIHEDQIKIWYDKLNEPYLTYISCSSIRDLGVAFTGINDSKEKALKRLKDETPIVESPDYQKKLDILFHEKEVSESIYTAYKQSRELIKKEIANIDEQLKSSLFNK